MKRIILTIALILIAAPAHAFWPFAPKPAPVTAPIHHITPEEINGENVIMAEKEAQEKARFDAWRKDHPEPAGPPKPRGKWCLTRAGHCDLHAIIDGIDSEDECNTKWKPTYPGALCLK